MSVSEAKHISLGCLFCIWVKEGEFGATDAIWTNNASHEQRSRMKNIPLNYSRFLLSADSDTRESEDGRVAPAAILDNPKAPPFEFIALEACLESACCCLEKESVTLEEEAHPALDKLTSKISTLNLEHVRQIKSRLVAITGRVQKVRDELEHLLDDDEDMAEMYLTDKLQQQGIYEVLSPHSSYDDTVSDNLDNENSPAKTSFEANDANYDHLIIQNQHHFMSGSSMHIGSGHGIRATSNHSSSKHLEVQDLEMLLEAYFVQIDGTLNKLSALREYVDDTEDYINIMLDDKQNHLLQMGVILTTATLIISAFIVLVGIFGMNIQIDLFDENKAGMNEFLWTVGGGAAGSILMYVMAVSWCNHRRLLE